MIEKEMAFRREELEKLSTLELDTILRTELDSDTPERETVLLVLSILEDRDPTDSDNRPAGAEEAWERLLHRPQHSEDEKPNSGKKLPKWFAGVAAAAVVALVLSVVVPQAVGAENIFQIIGRWTRDIFNLSDGTEPQVQDEYVFQTDHEGLQQLYDAVVAQEITDPVVPTWLPEGYKLIECRVFMENTKIYTNFCKGDYYLQIAIEQHNADSSYKYPKDDDSADLVELMGQKYYIIANGETWKVVWITNNKIECSITTNDTSEVLNTIIKSIHGRLDT